MTHEIPDFTNPTDQPHVVQGEVDPTSLPGGAEYQDGETFRRRQLPGYAVAEYEARQLDGMAVAGVTGAGIGIVGNFVLNEMLNTEGVPETAIAIADHASHSAVILGGVLMMVSAARSAIRHHKMGETRRPN